MTFFQFFWLFFCYSFLGWALEVVTSAVRERRYRDHGVLGGPLCLIYGVTGCLVTVGLRELAQDSLFFLFLFSAVIATAVEWIGGHILEWLTHARWWDYSGRRFNLDGYICLSASALWGVLGMVAVRWLAPLLLAAFGLMPVWLRLTAVWVLLGLLALDCAGTVLTLAGARHFFPQAEATHSRLANLTVRLGLWIFGRFERRMTRAYPQAEITRREREKSDVFAPGCSFYKIFLLFFIGAFLGDIVETIFCYLTMGVWMSRSSLVWGPFSVVWGMALALVTLLMYRYKDKSAAWLFVAGTLLGGAYEYLCSVFTELVFGAVFWDYSHIPFNLGGRINLLYCFFWGFAAVAWFKVCYPPLARWIERIPKRPGTAVTWVLILFMTTNMVMSSAALVRYNARWQGAPAANAFEQALDEWFDDDYIAKVYPKLKHR